MVERFQRLLTQSRNLFTSLGQKGLVFSRESLVRLIFGSRQEAFYEEVHGYWEVYGGFRALVRSRWLAASLIIAVVMLPLWPSHKWADLSLSVAPSLLGFSIGAMTIIFAFPSSPLFRFLAEGGRHNSYYMDVAAKFVHFALTQIVSILLSFLAEAYDWWPIDWIGCTSFCYALATAGATVFALFGVAQIQNRAAVLMEKDINNDV